MNEPLMKIGEIAAFFNVSVKAMRLYEKMGIITPVKVDPVTNYRYYTVEQVQQINALLELKSLGFSLSEIKDIIVGNTTHDQLLVALSRKKLAWQESIVAANNKIDAIESISSNLTDSETSKKLHELTDEQRSWLLVKMVCVEDIRGQKILSEALWL